MKTNTLHLWGAPTPNGSDHISPNTCHYTLVQDTAEPGAGRCSSCDAPAVVRISRMNFVFCTMATHRLQRWKPRPHRCGLWSWPEGLAVHGVVRQGLSWMTELGGGERWTHTQAGKWDSLIRLQLLHFTRKELFIDTASFIYFLNA